MSNANKGIVVKYHNDTNNLISGNLNASELDMLMSIFAKAKNQGTTKIMISEYELRKLSGYTQTNPKRIKKALETFIHKVFDMKIWEYNKEYEEMRIAHIFNEFSYKEKMLTIEIGKRFSYWLNHLDKNFTRFELSEFVEVKGKYAKQLYRLFKQFKSTGEKRISMKEFRVMLGVPKSYTNHNVLQTVLMPAIVHLEKYFNNIEVRYAIEDMFGKTYELSIDKYKATNPKPKIIGFHFVFESEKPRNKTAIEEKWLEENEWSKI